MNTPKPHISLILCTRNRADALHRALDAIARSDHAAVATELVVVDNGSSDETSTVIDRFASTVPMRVEKVSQPIPGLGNARNAGLAAATGDLIAFTDDDCYVASDYFTALRSSFENGSFSYSGGRILLFDPEDAFFACNNQETFEAIPAKSFVPAGKIQGANMAFRREVCEAVGPFDPELGAGTRFRCEDVDYIARASYAGFPGAHVPEIVVYHHHGRKPGEELKRLRRDNDYARGAYYGKRLLGGDLPIIYHWLRKTFGNWRRRRLITEIQGAVHYATRRSRR